MNEFRWKHVFYSQKQFRERLLNNDTVELCHVGPWMFICRDEMGDWLAIVQKPKQNE